MASNPSSPSAFYDFTTKIFHSTSSIVRRGIGTIVCCSYRPSSSIPTSKAGKNVDSSSSAYSVLLFVLDPSLFVNGGILSNAKVLLGSKYFATC
jgi:hypothetical protein